MATNTALGQHCQATSAATSKCFMKIHTRSGRDNGRENLMVRTRPPFINMIRGVAGYGGVVDQQISEKPTLAGAAGGVTGKGWAATIEIRN